MYSSLRNVCNGNDSNIFLHSSQENNHRFEKKNNCMLDTVGIFARIQKALEINEPVEIAKFLKITKQTVYGWRDGEAPKLKTLGMIAAKNGTSLHWLLTGEGEEKITPKEDTNLSRVEKLLKENSLPDIFKQLFNRIERLEATHTAPQKTTNGQSLDTAYLAQRLGVSEQAIILAEEGSALFKRMQQVVAEDKLSDDIKHMG